MVVGKLDTEEVSLADFVISFADILLGYNQNLNLETVKNKVGFAVPMSVGNGDKKMKWSPRLNWLEQDWSVYMTHQKIACLCTST